MYKGLISRIIFWIFVEGISTILGQEPECVNLFDDQSCINWARDGECTINPVWMVQNCRLACHACISNECVNLHNTDSCNNWAIAGECKANPLWMTDNCRLACGACADFVEEGSGEDRKDDISYTIEPTSKDLISNIFEMGSGEDGLSTKSELDNIFTEIPTDKDPTTEASGEENDVLSVTEIPTSAISETTLDKTLTSPFIHGNQFSTVINYYSLDSTSLSTAGLMQSLVPTAKEDTSTSISIVTSQTVSSVKTSAIVKALTTDTVKPDTSLHTDSFSTTLKLETESFSGDDETVSGEDDTAPSSSTQKYPTLSVTSSTDRIISTSQSPQKPEYSTLSSEFESTVRSSWELDKIMTSQIDTTTSSDIESLPPSQRQYATTVSNFNSTKSDTTKENKQTTKHVTVTSDNVPVVSTSLDQRKDTTLMFSSPSDATTTGLSRKYGVTSSVSETASGDEDISEEETSSGEVMFSTVKSISKTPTKLETTIVYNSTIVKLSDETTMLVLEENIVSTTEQLPETSQFQVDLTSETFKTSTLGEKSTKTGFLDETTETGSGEEVLISTNELDFTPTKYIHDLVSKTTQVPTKVQTSKAIDLDEATETTSGDEIYSTLKTTDYNVETTQFKLDFISKTLTQQSTPVELQDETSTLSKASLTTLQPTTVKELDEVTETASGEELISLSEQYPITTILEPDKTSSIVELTTSIGLLDKTTETASGEEMISTTKLYPKTTRSRQVIFSQTSTIAEQSTTMALVDEITETASGEELYSTIKSSTVKFMDETSETASGEEISSSTLKLTTIQLQDETTKTVSGEEELLSTIFPTSDDTESISGETDVTENTTDEVSKYTTAYVMDTTETVASAVIYLSNENNILKRENGLISSLINQDNGNIVGIAVDSETNALFWSNNANKYKGIYRSSLDGTGLERIISSDVYEVNGLAVDSGAKLLFWTDAQRRLIKVSRYDGQTIKTIVRTGLKAPRGIALDTLNGYIYWNDQGTRKIERSKYDGSSRETVFEGDKIYWPNQMTISKDGMQLMWVDAWQQNLNILNIGSKMLKTIDMSSQTNGSPAYGLAVIGFKAYVTIWGGTKLAVIDLHTEKIDVLNYNLGSDVLFSIALDDGFSKAGFHPCQTNNGGCSHLCLPTSQTTFVCTCPDTGGLLLSSNNKTCQSPAEFLLFGRMDTGEVMMLPSGQSKSHNNVAVIGRSSRPVGVAYDPIMQRVYWSDVQDRQIYSSRLGGNVKDVFLNASQGLGFVEGLFLDWQHRKLYFTNTDFVSIDGTAFSWHKIEVIDLDTMARRQIVTNVNQPRGLYVDSVNGHIYYTDIDDDEPKVMRCNLDGSEVKTIMTKAQDIQVPNDIMYKNGQLYVVDSYYKYQESGDTSVTGKLFSINPNNISLLKIISENLKVPFSMTMSGDKIYVSDWGRRAILEVHPSTGQIIEVLSDVDEATGILYAVKKEIISEIVEAPCNATCSGLCLKEDSSMYDCVCDTYHLSWMTSTHSQQCSASENFVIVSDLNAIKYKAIEAEADKGITDIYVLHEGNKYFSSFVALDYDKSNNVVYYSDVNRGTIEKYYLISKENIIVYKGPEVINDLMITSSHVYWASESVGCIRRAPLHNMLSVTDIVCNLNQPRSLALANMVGYLYWSELGPQPSVWRSRIDGTGRRKIWSENGTFPNSVFFDSNRFAIYILDSGNKKIVECNLDGSFCVDFLRLQGKGPYFGLQKQGNFIYYSDWGSHSIMMHEFKEKFSSVLVKNLIRPSRFVVIHPRAISDNCRNSECTDQCKAYPGGFMCKCFDGRKQINKLTCISGSTVVVHRIPNTQLSIALLSDQGTTEDRDSPFNMTTEQPFVNMTTIQASEASSESSTVPISTVLQSSTRTMPVVDQDTTSQFVKIESSPYTEATSDSISVQTEGIKIPATKTTTKTQPITSQTTTSSSRFISQDQTTTSKLENSPQMTSEETKSTGFDSRTTKTVPQGVTQGVPSTVTQTRLTTEKLSTVSQPSTKSDVVTRTVEVTSKQSKLSSAPIFETTATTQEIIIGLSTKSVQRDITTEDKLTSQSLTTSITKEAGIPSTGPLKSTTGGNLLLATSETSIMTSKVELPVETVTSAKFLDILTTGISTPKIVSTHGTNTITKGVKETTLESTISTISGKVTTEISLTTAAIKTNRISTATKAMEGTTLDLTIENPKASSTVTPSEIVTTSDQGLLTTLSPMSPQLTFLYCPDDMNVYAFGDNKQVWWKEPAVIPEPYVTDQVEVSSNYASGDQLPLGRVEVVYTAVLKSYSKEANCTFYVNVTKQEFVCSPTPVVQNGDLQCDHTNFIYGCKAKCDEGFLNTYDTIYTCKTSGWEPAFPAGYPQLACKRKVTNSTSVDIVITFNGPCTQISSPEFQNTFKEQITNILKTSGICSVENLYQLCNSQLYSLECDNELRKKRAINNEKINLMVKMWYPHSDPPTSEIYAALKPLEDIINAGIVAVSLQNNDYIASSVIAYINNVTQCPPGSIPANNICVLCPMGSYYKASTTTCEPCASGYYQGYEGQDFCEKCPGSSTTDAGAFLAKQCRSKVTEKTTQEPTDTRNNKILPLVIGLSVVGGLLFLAAIALAAYTCHRVFRRKKGEILFDHEKMAAKYKNRLYSHSAYGAIAHVGEDFRNGKNKAVPQYKGVQKYSVDKYHPPPKVKTKVRIQTRSPTGSLEKSPHRNNNVPRNYSNPKAWTPSPTGSLEKTPVKTHMKPEEYVIVSPYPVSQKKPPVRKMAPVMDKYQMKRLKVGKSHGGAKPRSPPQRAMQGATPGGVYVKRRQEPPRYYMVETTGWRSLSDAEKATH